MRILIISLGKISCFFLENLKRKIQRIIFDQTLHMLVLNAKVNIINSITIFTILSDVFAFSKKTGQNYLRLFLIEIKMILLPVEEHSTPASSSWSQS